MTLRAGPVSALLQGADLRHVRLGEFELAQRVYVAVRDGAWNTIPARLEGWVYELEEDRSRVSFRAQHAHGDIRFHWVGTIEGTPEGAFHYTLEGRCMGTFSYSKIGFNVHHALDGSVGRPFRATTATGLLRGELPEAIDPQRVIDDKLSGMFAPYSSIAIEVADGLEAVVGLEGDLLEMQDHRNWADANFKSYGTPLALGYPFTAEDGQVIRQVLSVSFDGWASGASAGQEPVVKIGKRSIGRLPTTGFGLAVRDQPLSVREATLLRQLRPDHLRVDVRLRADDHLAILERACRDAADIGAPLELALHVDDSSAPALHAVAAGLRELRPAVARVLVYAAAGGFSAAAATTPPDLITLVRQVLDGLIGNAVVAGGTDQSFVDVNRDRPIDASLGGICFMVSPTVHADDDDSIVENIAGVGEVIRMAVTIAGGRQVIVSPITLATRYGPYPGGPVSEGELPPSVDVRQASLLGAAWTVGAVSSAAEAGADSVTWYETTGWRGLIETDEGPPSPRFPSRPGQVFPMYHVFADIAEWRAAELLDVVVSRPLEIASLAVKDATGVHGLIANVTPEPQRLTIEGLLAPVRLRILDEGTAERAVRDPDAHRAMPPAQRHMVDGALCLALGPFAVVRFDEA